MKRAGLAAAGLALAAAGLWQATRPAALTLSNSGLSAAYPPAAAWGALAAAAGLALVLAALPPGRLRLLPVVPALLFVLLAGERACYRIEAGRETLSVRGLGGREQVPWKAVEAVQPEEDGLRVRAGQLELRLRLGPLDPAERPSLERTIARRVREAQGAPATP